MDELELKFDTMEDNTDLAQDYISAHSEHFVPTYDFNYLGKLPVECTDSRLFEKLARKIEENAELFAQLEALIRNKRKEDVKKWDIHLLVQVLLHQSNQKCYPNNLSDCIQMCPDSPLADLGHVALKLTRYKVLIYASENTLAVSYLFTKLCHEVGLMAVGLDYASHPGRSGWWGHEESLGTLWCVGVITEHADTGSAVDTLLSSTTQYPWKVRRIFIQESIYDTVIKTLEWKCSMKPTEGTVPAKLNQSCSDTKFYEDKLLLFDYTGNYKFYEEDPIFVGTYRTSKELLSLMSRYEPLCLSLWSCDVAESDEIAFSVNTPIVWVNEFGSFWGSPDAAEAYYSSVYTEDVDMYKMNSDIEKLLKLRDAWKKIDIRSRKAILMEVINSCADYDNNKEKVLKLISSQRWRDSEKFVEFQNNRICIGRRDRDELYVPIPSSDPVDVEKVFGFLIGGGAVLLKYDDDDEFHDWLEALMKKRVPIMYVGNCGKVKVGGVKYNMIAKPNTKVVYKSFGTIFVN